MNLLKTVLDCSSVCIITMLYKNKNLLLFTPSIITACINHRTDQNETWYIHIETTFSYVVGVQQERLKNVVGFVTPIPKTSLYKLVLQQFLNITMYQVIFMVNIVNPHENHQILKGKGIVLISQSIQKTWRCSGTFRRPCTSKSNVS